MAVKEMPKLSLRALSVSQSAFASFSVSKNFRCRFPVSDNSAGTLTHQGAQPIATRDSIFRALSEDDAGISAPKVPYSAVKTRHSLPLYVTLLLYLPRGELLT